jgi:hypothetical protein
LDGVVPSNSDGHDWQHGFGVCYVSKDNHFIEGVQIKNGESMFHGKLYKGIDYAEDVARDTGHTFLVKPQKQKGA